MKVVIRCNGVRGFLNKGRDVKPAESDYRKMVKRKAEFSSYIGSRSEESVVVEKLARGPSEVGARGNRIRANWRGARGAHNRHHGRRRGPRNSPILDIIGIGRVSDLVGRTVVLL